MRRKLLRLALAVIGFALLVLGAVRVAAAFEEDFHRIGSGTTFGFSLVLPLHWVALTLVGAFACFLSYWLFRKRA